MAHSPPILVIDVGGSHAKAKVDDGDKVKVPTGPDAQPQPVVAELQRRIPRDSYEGVTIGVPTPVVNGRLTTNPKNLGPGWAEFDFVEAFGCPVRLINDAALQAIGGYRSGRMLFLGFGTGLGGTSSFGVACTECCSWGIGLSGAGEVGKIGNAPFDS